ncbi:hypothetical protein [Paraburkholderia caribensis]|uniref:hypothetical protein n=1 Tax=Paraburkholderia caribensis TaxID=75105 RepID=UPI001CC7E8CF|nr:hypothetical protein [Paraburkholderia caribensis]
MDATAAAVQQTYAAWVQAIGSILAIVAAFIVASRQSAAAREQRITELKERLDAIAEMLLHASKAVSEFHANAKSCKEVMSLVFPATSKVTAARIATTAVKEISTSDITRARVVVALIKAKTAIANTEGNWPMPAGDFHVGWFDAIDGLQRHLFDAHLEVKSEADKTGKR